MTEARFTSLEKDPSDALFAYRQQRLASFKDLAAAKLRLMYSLAPEERDTSHGKPSEMSAGSGDELPDSTFTHIN